MILLVLIQRGRGGGLAGAFGGMGGQSAFGTKAGDLFTRVTIVTAAIWILLCAASVKIFSSATNRLSTAVGATQSDAARRQGTGRSGDAEKAGAQPGGDAVRFRKLVAAAHRGPASYKSAGRPAQRRTADSKPATDKTPAAENQ